MFSIVLLNSMNLAAACRCAACFMEMIRFCRQGLTHGAWCSTYYSFCGNAGVQRNSEPSGELRQAVCSKWLHPIRLSDHPAYSGWVLVGEFLPKAGLEFSGV